jgi:tetratricopeptide (TPR) repeat protein
MQSINDLQREESQMKLARVDSAQVSTSCEYDDGMHVFKEPFPAKGDEIESVRSAIMFYNSGQTQVGLGQYEKAGKCFGLAYIRIKLDTTAGASALFVRIVHNLGYCHYRLGDSVGAKNCFITALELARLAGLEERGIDSINNSLGVLCSDKEDRTEEVVSV